MLRRIRIAIDPRLKERFAPEICWVWRYLLTAIGLPWEEVDIDSSEYEIGYFLNKESVNKCLLFIQADYNYWSKKESFRFSRLGKSGEWRYPIFESEIEPSEFLYTDNNRLFFKRDIIFYAFWVLTGQQEKFYSRDKHGHIISRGRDQFLGEFNRLALASNIGCNLEKEFIKLDFKPEFERWPAGKKFAACVGHDVDYPEIIKWLEPLRLISRFGARGIKSAVSLIVKGKDYWNFQFWVDMEKLLNTKSAFYFTARQGSLCEYIRGTPDPFYNVQAKRFRELFKYLREEGLEIGLHASYNAFRSPGKFAYEKAFLEEASGEKICGNRHHYWHMDPRSPEDTLLMHEQVGLLYDASLIHERYIGWRRGSSWPFFPFHQQQRREIRALQLTTSWMDDQLFGHKSDNPGENHQILCALSDLARNQGGCIFIDVHDYVYDKDLYPGWLDVYRKFWEYINQVQDSWKATPKQAAEHWVNRYNLILGSSLGLRGGY